MGKKSRTKGATGERECRDVFRANGWPEADRSGEMQAGAKAKKFADLTGTGWMWVECKRHRKVPIAKLAHELLAEERPGYDLVLASRDDDRTWLGTMSLDRLAACFAELERLRAMEARVRVLNPAVHEALCVDLPALDLDKVTAR